MKQDLYTYRRLRQIYLHQREFFRICDRQLQLQEHRDRARHDRILSFLGKRRKFARSLTNGRYDEYGCIVRSR